MNTKKLAKVLTLSILLTIVCLPFGIVPLIYSIMATINKDDMNVGNQNLTKATKWLKICAVAMVVTYIAIVGLLISLMQ